MNTLLVDPPAAPRSEQPTATDRDGGHSGGSGPDGHPPAPPGPQGRTCANCDAPIQDSQQWCLHCGAAQPGSLAERQSWRPLTALALAAVLLVGAAAAAGAAALSSNPASKPPVPVASAPAPTASTPTTSVPTTPTVPATPGAAGTPTVPAGGGGVKSPPVGTGTGSGNSLFPSTGKPPKVPSTTPTPKSSETGAGVGTGTGFGTGSSEKTSTTTGSKSESGRGGEKQTKEAPSPLLLDTDAASTYNPYNYPTAGFGDPALAIDGEPTTAWTAQVQPSSAPNMAEGLLLDLKSPTKVGAVTLVTQTKGTTVQFYGTTDKQAPATITEHGWKQISAARVLRKKTTHVKLHGDQALRYLLVWVVKAPESAVGTPTAPGHVNLDEVELFPPSS